jgi:hypothetical protein
MTTGRLTRQVIGSVRERVARQVVAARVAPYVQPPSDKALGDLLGESLLIELLGK